MNRTERRRCARLQRAELRRHHTRRHEGKLTHKLPPQPCTVYFPDTCTYLVDMDGEPLQITTVTAPELATVLPDHVAEEIAALVKASTGMRTKVRPFFAHDAGAPAPAGPANSPLFGPFSRLA